MGHEDTAPLVGNAGLRFIVIGMVVIGDGLRTALRWATCWALLGVAGCDALDRGLLDPVVRRGPDDMNGPLDGGGSMDSGAMPPPSGGSTGSGGSSGNGGSGGEPSDSGAMGDARVDETDAGPIEEDAADDAGPPTCGDPGADCCPEDPNKVEPGACGCGVADVDGDGDEAPDCTDLCPSDPNKAAPGACGCGLAETEAASCSVLRSALQHRYRFNGTGTVLEDSVSDADGTVVSASLSNSGTLTLAGGTTNQHVDLPDGMISALTDATFEVWLSWTGGTQWERVFDFGSSSGGSGQTYLFITPRRGSGAGNMRVTMSLSGTASEVVLDAPAQLPTNALHHIALVVDDQNELRLFLDGVLQGSVANARRLSELDDVNNWIARSNYSNDNELGGTYHELRIYDAALTDAQIAASFAFGPDPVFLE